MSIHYIAIEFDFACRFCYNKLHVRCQQGYFCTAFYFSYKQARATNTMISPFTRPSDTGAIAISAGRALRFDI